MVTSTMQSTSTAYQKCNGIILHNKHVFITTSMLAHGYKAHTYSITKLVHYIGRNSSVPFNIKFSQFGFIGLIGSDEALLDRPNPLFSDNTCTCSCFAQKKIQWISTDHSWSARLESLVLHTDSAPQTRRGNSIVSIAANKSNSEFGLNWCVSFCGR